VEEPAALYLPLPFVAAAAAAAAAAAVLIPSCFCGNTAQQRLLNCADSLLFLWHLFCSTHQNVPDPAPIKLGTADHTSLPSYVLLLQLGSGTWASARTAKHSIKQWKHNSCVELTGWSWLKRQHVCLCSTAQLAIQSGRLT
jgi:hypothetical protein